MKPILFLLFLLPLLFACNAKKERVEDLNLLNSLLGNDSISDKDARIILTQLEYMLSDACDRAEDLVKKGINRKDVRDSLSRDSDYIYLAKQANSLDSILLDYLSNSKKATGIRIEYKNIVKRNIKRARDVGLN